MRATAQVGAGHAKPPFGIGRKILTGGRGRGDGRHRRHHRTGRFSGQSLVTVHAAGFFDLAASWRPTCWWWKRGRTSDLAGRDHRAAVAGRQGQRRNLMNATATRPLAVVTGASSGIGRELAARFAEGGFDLVVAAEDERISEAARALAGHGITAVPVRADLATFDGVEDLYQAGPVRTGRAPRWRFQRGRRRRRRLRQGQRAGRRAAADRPEHHRRGAPGQADSAGHDRGRERGLLFHLLDRGDRARALLRDLRRVQGVPAVLRRGAAVRAAGHRRDGHRADARPTDTEFFDCATWWAPGCASRRPRTTRPRWPGPGFEAAAGFYQDHVVAGAIRN